MKNILISFIVIVASCTNLFAQDIPVAKLDSLYDLLETNEKFMGSVMMSHKGEVIYSNAVGYESIAEEKEASLDSKYRIGSISKTFTAVMILEAVEEGKIELSQTIEKYFPKVENASEIKIEYLLNHQSGIFNVTQREDVEEWSYTKQRKKDMLALVEDSGSVFKPGEKHEYSNSNYLLLTFILEEIYEVNYAELLENKITKPLELKNTYVGGKIGNQENECHSYSFTSTWEDERETNMSVPLGAGAIVSNPKDLTVFMRALFQGKIISEKSLEKMIDTKDDFGLGIFKYQLGEQIAYGHSGGIDGFVSFAAYFPKEDACIAMTSNALNYDDKTICLTTMGAFYGRSFDLPDFTKYDVDPKHWSFYTGDYDSKDIPANVTIIEKDNQLFASVNGSEGILMDPSGLHEFKDDKNNAKIKFFPDRGTFMLMQHGQFFEFAKKE